MAEVKQTEMHERVRQSIHPAGWLPHLFRAVVGQYNWALAEWEREVQECQQSARSDPPKAMQTTVPGHTCVRAANSSTARGYGDAELLLGQWMRDRKIQEL